MTGLKMERMKRETKNYVRYVMLKGKKRGVKVAIVLFDHKNTIIECDSIEALERVNEDLDQYCIPGAASAYSEPLKFLLELIQSDKVRCLNAVFLTDGEDRTSDIGLTDSLITRLREEINQRNILTKVSIMALGDHDVAKVAKIGDLGMPHLKGQYFYVNHFEKEEDVISSITAFFEEVRHESKLPFEGLLLSFKGTHRKIFVPFDSQHTAQNNEQRVSLKRTNLLLQGYDLVESILKKFVQPTLITFT